jgi:hypothetical protein
MHKVLAITLVLGGLLVAGPSLAAPVSFPECCACVGQERAQSGVVPPKPATPALLCAEIADPDAVVKFDSACQGAGGGGVFCTGAPGAHSQPVQDGDNLDCAALLLESENIQCVHASAAPLLGMPALGGLGLLLAALGVWAVRHRNTLTRGRVES